MMAHLPTLLLQIAVILIAARLVGRLFRKIHQPQVMGEMLAGILLGPSLLGWLSPQASLALFPPESLGYLSALSQIGLVLFMFLVGLELDPQILKGRTHAALMVSHASIVAPFFLGVALALILYPRLSDDSVSFTNFALFLGTAMSITAFPVLARILAERNLLNTQMGSVAITCAAVDDVTGWIILAAVLLVARIGQSAGSMLMTLLGVVVYLTIMFLVVRRVGRWLERVWRKYGSISHDMMALILLMLILSSLATEWLGIHALFGAFMLGIVMPKQPSMVHELSVKMYDTAVVLLLPLFFAFTGLRTSIGSLMGIEAWILCLVIILVAVAGKFIGSTLASRYGGMTWRESMALGVLMNTRGLMELVLLNIGLEIGVISEVMFTMLVIMALTTTFMTAPLLEWIYFSRVKPKAYTPPAEESVEPVPETVSSFDLE